MYVIIINNKKYIIKNGKLVPIEEKEEIKTTDSQEN